MKYVVCLDDGKRYGFTARTAYEAMKKMLYFLNMSMKDDNARINKTVSGRTLYIEHCGRIYSTINI